MPPWIVAIQALIDFEVIGRLCNIGENALRSQLRELHDGMEKDYKLLKTGNDEDAYFRHINDEYIEVSETLPCLYWYSQFQIAFSFFEKTLNTFCAAFKNQNALSITVNDMSGQGISRAQIYLSKVCDKPEPFQLPEWSGIKMCSEIRNAITHRSGFIDLAPDTQGSLYNRLVDAGYGKQELADQKDVQIILSKENVMNSIQLYSTVIKAIAGLGHDFITPKHGHPGIGHTDI